jgi:hypothetical protein
VTVIEEKLIEVGTALARSLGHKFCCPKIASRVPCMCEVLRTQAQALADWEHLMQQIKES